MRKNSILSGSFIFLVSAVIIAGCNSNKWSSPESYRKIKNPVEKNDTTVRAGQELYNKYCLTCHGKTGHGDGLKSAALTQSPGDFSKKNYQDQTDGELFYKTKTGKGEMPGYEGIISDNDIWAVVAYTRNFTPKSPKGDL